MTRAFFYTLTVEKLSKPRREVVEAASTSCRSHVDKMFKHLENKMSKHLENKMFKPYEQNVEAVSTKVQAPRWSPPELHYKVANIYKLCAIFEQQKSK